MENLENLLEKKFQEKKTFYPFKQYFFPKVGVRKIYRWQPAILLKFVYTKLNFNFVANFLLQNYQKSCLLIDSKLKVGLVFNFSAITRQCEKISIHTSTFDFCIQKIHFSVISWSQFAAICVISLIKSFLQASKMRQLSILCFLGLLMVAIVEGLDAKNATTTLTAKSTMKTTPQPATPNTGLVTTGNPRNEDNEDNAVGITIWKTALLVPLVAWILM